MLEIRAIHNQIGLTIEAREPGKDWILVQLTKYREREASPSVRQYRTCIDPLRDEQEYFAHLDAKGVKYRKVN